MARAWSRAAATTSATGQRRLSGTRTSRSGSRAAWRLTARVNCGPSAVSRRIPGTTPLVLTVMCRAPEPEPARIGQGGDRLEHPVEVEQRLAHAHEHDVGQALAVGRQAAGRGADLVDDLGGLEVAGEAELAGRAERAADGAAGLARDADGVPLAVAGPGRVVHQDRLDQRAVGQPMERLLGQAAIGRPGSRSRAGCRTGRRRRARLEGRMAAFGRRRPRAPRRLRPTPRRRPGGRGSRAPTWPSTRR